MSTELQDVRTSFDWQPQPLAAALVARLLQQCIRDNPQIAQLGRRLRDETGTRLVDWVDVMTLPPTPELEADLLDAGFARDHGEDDAWRHPEGIFPAVQLADQPPRLAIKVSSVDDFAAALGQDVELSGEPGSQYRVCTARDSAACRLVAIERHGWK
ncbi:MAG TPA: hypothetical protein PJ982_12555, partial [Lacipirellulaceae bacterium]|nr:hypothetical protein [Lacipirellulaceae bacterium]